MTTWLTDSKDNRTSLEYFGSQEAAQKALDSLIDCENCTNCSHCSHCSHCSRCSDCSHCSRCSDCSGCSGCSHCSHCSDCSHCSHCSHCSDCSRCSGCSGCSDCSHVAFLHNKKNLQGDPDAAPGTFGPPPIPTIENIHAKVLAAVTAEPGALDMSTWHTCKSTHCRAGWVVHLAGEAGYALERFHDTALAAQLIYRESNPAMPVAPTRFYETNDEAMADMRKMAEREASGA